MMDRAAAEAALAEAELIPYREGPLAAVKEFERECLSREFPCCWRRRRRKSAARAAGVAAAGQKAVRGEKKTFRTSRSSFARSGSSTPATVGEGLVS